jgi:integrase
MGNKLTKDDLAKLIDRPGRHGDGDGLYFRAIGERRAYFVYRYRAAGKEREVSIGPYPEVSLADARAKHAALRKIVVSDKRDPLADKRAAKAAVATPSVKPTFREIADDYIATHEASWRNAKHREQWRNTLGDAYCSAIRDLPVDKVDTTAVLKVLLPIWTKIPETASRLRGRIETILSSAQVAGHIPEDRSNPARWRGWLEHRLPNAKKIGERGHHAALPYADLPKFMARLGREPGTVAKALAFIILTAARSGEALGMTWDEVDLATATWTVPKERMKAGKAHVVPLSDQALAILRGQYQTRGKNPHVFPSHLPRQALWSASLALVMRRLGANATTHGMRASFRMWAADQGIAFEVAEQCLAHTVGSAVVQAYQRSSMLERRRPVMDAWASFVMPKPDAKVVPIKMRASLKRTRA